jgi:hypothetical protein
MPRPLFNNSVNFGDEYCKPAISSAGRHANLHRMNDSDRCASTENGRHGEQVVRRSAGHPQIWQHPHRATNFPLLCANSGHHLCETRVPVSGCDALDTGL